MDLRRLSSEADGTSCNKGDAAFCSRCYGGLCFLGAPPPCCWCRAARLRFTPEATVESTAKVDALCSRVTGHSQAVNQINHPWSCPGAALYYKLFFSFVSHIIQSFLITASTTTFFREVNVKPFTSNCKSRGLNDISPMAFVLMMPFQFCSIDERLPVNSLKRKHLS